MRERKEYSNAPETNRNVIVGCLVQFLRLLVVIKTSYPEMSL